MKGLRMRVREWNHPRRNSRTCVVNLRCAHRSQLRTRWRKRTSSFSGAYVGTTAPAETMIA